jgi:hypothetical protein
MPDENVTQETATKRRPSRDEARCSVDGCKRPYRAKSYCNVHYKAWRRGTMEGHRARYKICTKEGCRKPRALGSLCAEHAGKGEAAAPA